MTRPAKPSPAANDDSDTGSAQQTPSADMQPEDTGTAESGNSGSPAAAEKTMKQGGKTEAERDGKG